MGGIYTQKGDYLLPNLALPTEEEQAIGVWGQSCLRYLRVLYYNLLTSGKLYFHLADVEEQAQELFFRLVNEYSKRESVDEQLKAADQMSWVQKVNNIREQAWEVFNSDVILT